MRGTPGKHWECGAVRKQTESQTFPSVSEHTRVKAG